MSAGFEVDNTSWDDFLAGIRAEAEALRAQRLDAPAAPGEPSEDPAATSARWMANLAAKPAPRAPVDAQAAAERYERAAGDVVALLAQLDRSDSDR